jgi:hypothetical protein
MPPSTVDGTPMASNFSTTLRQREPNHDKRKTSKAPKMQRNFGVSTERAKYSANLFI